MPTLTSDQLDALQKRNIMRRMFVYVDALDPDTGDPSPAGFWDDLGTVTVDGKDYTGSGNVMEIASISAKSDLSIAPMVVTLSGIASAAAHLVRGETVGQRPISLAIGIFDVDTRQVIGSLVPMFNGYIDDVEIKTPQHSNTSQIVLTCESVARELTIKSTDTRSHESQMIRKSGDLFFKYTEGVREQVLYFGRKEPRNRKSNKK